MAPHKGLRVNKILWITIRCSFSRLLPVVQEVLDALFDFFLHYFWLMLRPPALMVLSAIRPSRGVILL